MEVGVEVVHARDCKLLLDTDIYKVVRKGTNRREHRRIPRGRPFVHQEHPGRAGW